MSTFITVEYFNEIRDQLGGISASVISDEDIQKLSYLARAESYVKQVVPNWQAILSGTDEEKKQVLVVATILLTAAYLIPKIVRGVRSESIGDYSYTSVSDSEWKDRHHALIDEAYALLKGLFPASTASLDTPVFGVAGPSRVEAQVNSSYPRRTPTGWYVW